MKADWHDLPELRDLGANLSLTRLERGFSQGRLARECKLSQAQVSLFESGRRLPSLDKFVRLARALDVPIQRLLSGVDRPGLELRDLAVELRNLGADLWVADAAIPGVARCPEEVVALAASGSSPDPRVVETLPALLSWNEINPLMLRAYGVATKTTYRLAWLADVALAVERQQGFPGGCRRGPLERFIRIVGLPPQGAAWDDLGRPAESPSSSPVWRRWKTSYGAEMKDFTRRTQALASAHDLERKAAKVERVRARVIVGQGQGGAVFPRVTSERTKVSDDPGKVRWRVQNPRKGRASGQ